MKFFRRVRAYFLGNNNFLSKFGQTSKFSHELKGNSFKKLLDLFSLRYPLSFNNRKIGLSADESFLVAVLLFLDFRIFSFFALYPGGKDLLFLRLVRD